MSFKITKPVRLIETFSGVGTFSMALRDLQISYETWKTSDWDVNAVRSFKAIHFPNDNTDYSEGMSKEDLVQALYKLSISADGKSPLAENKIKRKGEAWLRETYNAFKATHNLGSIMNVHAEDLEIKDKNFTYLLSYSFPCQDISVAGKQAGFTKNTQTRSGLLWEIERILNECEELNCLPDVLCMENVNAIHNKKNMPDFQMWLDFLSSKGYITSWADMNSKDYGIAQNRCRTFALSIHKSITEEPYIFPESIRLTSRLKDYLEKKVDAKYYINNEKAQKLIQDLINRGVLPEKKISTALLTNKGEKFYKYTDVSGTLMARQWKGFSTQAFEGIIENENGTEESED